jgi:hypothetical protein
MMTADEERKKQIAKQERERELSGLPPKRKFTSHDPQAEFRQQVDEATLRGSAEIADTRRRLATGPASSANRRTAQAAAQRKNQPAIDLLKQGGALGFNPLATRKA